LPLTTTIYVVGTVLGDGFLVDAVRTQWHLRP
jgi:hypothetical protein